MSEDPADFQRRCRERLEDLGDIEMESGNYIEAAEHFSTILSFKLFCRVHFLVKWNRARALTASWDEALCDADQVRFVSRRSEPYR